MPGPDSVNNSTSSPVQPPDPSTANPPLWAWELKREVDALRSTKDKEVGRVEILQDKMEKLMGMVNGLISATSISATSDDKPFDEKPRVKPSKVTTSVDVLKVSKRARQITNLEGGPFQGIGDKRGFIAMRREILAKPEFVYATGGGEEGAAIEYFYVMNNISAPLQQQVTSQCRSNDCANFEDRVSTMRDCLRRSSDLNDQLSLIRRWETLS
ncbi:hypothetical protein FOZ63_025889 [Perkinsus olseni]|uniref:Uncharacterized protein n=1 Tax=Perkinsus olseni TaxID=32597 RepID=A0A7J6Q6F3_PEROL|nr:hypothetical protein FOZ60_013242 [Perkinsus olseni]KAF4704085.1 hypothetical protein FOZ63_025889 [Perkinsus olseni]KAF4715248.1 hypothetical protein FOZ62_018804 [Perkinsus olseni]